MKITRNQIRKLIRESLNANNFCQTYKPDAAACEDFLTSAGVPGANAPMAKFLLSKLNDKTQRAKLIKALKALPAVKKIKRSEQLKNFDFKTIGQTVSNYLKTQGYRPSLTETVRAHQLLSEGFWDDMLEFASYTPAGLFLGSLIGCEPGQDYGLHHVVDDLSEDMQMPKCMQMVYLDPAEKEGWPDEGLDLEGFKQQFEGEKYIDVFETYDIGKHGSLDDENKGVRGLVVHIHNVGRGSESLLELDPYVRVLSRPQGSDEDKMQYTYDTTAYDGAVNIATLRMVFPTKDGRVYYNDNHYHTENTPDAPEIFSQWRELPASSVLSQLYRGPYNSRNAEYRSDLPGCEEAFDRYLAKVNPDAVRVP